MKEVEYWKTAMTEKGYNARSAGRILANIRRHANEFRKYFFVGPCYANLIQRYLHVGVPNRGADAQMRSLVTFLVPKLDLMRKPNDPKRSGHYAFGHLC